MQLSGNCHVRTGFCFLPCPLSQHPYFLCHHFSSPGQWALNNRFPFFPFGKKSKESESCLTVWASPPTSGSHQSLKCLHMLLGTGWTGTGNTRRLTLLFDKQAWQLTPRSVKAPRVPSPSVLRGTLTHFPEFTISCVYQLTIFLSLSSSI